MDIAYLDTEEGRAHVEAQFAAKDKGLRLELLEGKNSWKLISLYDDEHQNLHHRLFGMDLGGIVLLRVVERYNNRISTSLEMLQDFCLIENENKKVWDIERIVI